MKSERIIVYEKIHVMIKMKATRVCFLLLCFFCLNKLKSQATNKIDTVGNIGIGILSPPDRLSVSGKISFFNYTGESTPNRVIGAIGGRTRLYGNTENASFANISIMTDASTWYKGAIAFATNNIDGTDGTTPPTERMRITANGSIGIGVTNPQEFFHVRTGNVSGIRIESTGNAPILDFYNSGVNHNFRLGVYNGDGMEFLSSSSIGGAPINSVMFIRHDGNIGVGTVLPSEKLSVNGNIAARKIKITQLNWSDYVFEGDYKLPTLSSLERYIVQNKRLPEVPSSEEVEEKGIDLGSTQALLLKKIEELTLYIIRLNKENIELSARIKKLEGRFN